MRCSGKFLPPSPCNKCKKKEKRGGGRRKKKKKKKKERKGGRGKGGKEERRGEIRERRSGLNSEHLASFSSCARQRDLRPGPLFSLSMNKCVLKLKSILCCYFLWSLPILLPGYGCTAWYATCWLSGRVKSVAPPRRRAPRRRGAATTPIALEKNARKSPVGAARHHHNSRRNTAGT